MPTYTGISSEAFRHPLDRQAEQALRSVPGFDLVARKFVEFLSERPQYVYQMGNSIQVGPRQYASVYQIFQECLRDLDIYPEPNLFVSQNPLVNAFALGQEFPFIVLNSGLLDLMSETELRTVIAHELGHIKCKHTTLIQMAIWTTQLISGLAERTFGLSLLISTGLVMAFYEWLRKAELSADRAALLVMDELHPITNGMMKIAGGSAHYAHELNLDEFTRQSERYQGLDEDGLNQIYKFFLYNNLSAGIFLTHPFTVERVYYLREWSTSEEYRQIRQGNYQRAGAEGAVDVSVESPPKAAQSGQSGQSTQPQPTQVEVNDLRRQIDELQQEIDRIKRGE
ncbi:MAG: M48 family metallopeptidase [Leptolyngbyaceae cyanobacterium RU_5_1]|nr:M48 family metallopeptidase [Leptolyngbyaceae cyanobacterium RU_5_1]